MKIHTHIYLSIYLYIYLSIGERCLSCSFLQLESITSKTQQHILDIANTCLKQFQYHNTNQLICLFHPTGQIHNMTWFRRSACCLPGVSSTIEGLGQTSMNSVYIYIYIYDIWYNMFIPIIHLICVYIYIYIYIYM